MMGEYKHALNIA